MSAGATTAEPTKKRSLEDPMSDLNSKDANAAEDDNKRFVVVTTKYPTTYGCHRGKSWSRADLIVHSDVEVSAETYDTYQEAVEAAIEARDMESEYFMDEDFTDQDNTPPFDSAVLENYDNDEEMRIDVMTKGAYDKQRADEALYLEKARAQRQFEVTLQQAMTRLRVKEHGGTAVHYSMPRKPYDIPAELELYEAKVPNLDAYEIPDNAASIKSFMYKGKSPDFFHFLDADPMDPNHALMRVLRACTSLEGLYILSDSLRDIIDQDFFQMVLREAPHLQQTLQVLSVPEIQLTPEALRVLPQVFPHLVRLDIRNCLTSEFYRGDYSDDEESLPYDDAVMACFIQKGGLSKLQRLDFGFQDGDQKRQLTNYMLSKKTLRQMETCLSTRGVVVTRKDGNVPLEFSSKVRNQAAKAQALVQMWEDERLPQPVRSLAEDQLKKCPICQKRATKRCSSCKRQWYCSAECQTKHFSKQHKPVCKEVFEE